MKKRFKLIFLFFWIGISLYPQETGYLSGFLKDRLTQDPLFGVKIKAGNHAALSDLDGFFELQLRPGEYPIQFSRYGMQTLTINGVIIPANDTVILDTALMPVPVAVAGVRASNEGSYVSIEWNPSGPNINERSNDTGPVADYFVFQQASSQVAVKYENNNDHIVGGRIFVGDGTFPGPFLGTDFLVRVYDDEGMEGLPGNALDEDTILVEQYGWVGFDNLDVNPQSDNYYLGMLQLNDPPFCAPIACTQYPSVSQSLMKPGDYNWCPFPSGNAMIRTWVAIPHDSLYVTNYRVMRYSSFDPETEDPTQGTMVELANTGLGTSYHDFAWGGMPEGCYAYGIKAMYNNGLYSPVRVSNVICNAPPNNTALNVNQTDNSTEGYAHVTLTGQNWEFSRYSSWFQTPGTCNFGSVSSGKYQVAIYKPGYEMIIQDSIEIMSDTVLALSLQEKIYPIENLWVNSYTGILDWEPEHIAQYAWDCDPDSVCHFLTTPEMDLTVNAYWILTLTYKMPTDLEPASVNYSTDHGRTWALFQTLETNETWDTIDIDISGFAGTLGESQIMFSIHDFYSAPYYLEIKSAKIWSPDLRVHPENYNITLNGQPAGMSDSSFYKLDGLVNGGFYRAGVLAEYSTGITDTVFTEFLYHELFPPENFNWTEENYSLKFSWSPPSGSWQTTNKAGYPDELKGYILTYTAGDLDLKYEINGPSDTTISFEKINCDTASVSLYAVYNLNDLGYPGEYGESNPAGPLEIAFEDPVENEFYEDWTVISFVHNCWKTNGDGFAIEAGQGHPGPALIYQNTPEHYQDFLTGLPMHIPQIADAQLTLEFDLNLFTSGQNGYETMEVQVQQAGASSWSQVQGVSNSFGNIEWQHFSINLTEFISSEVFRIRFMFEGIGEEGVQWKIDNIHVYNLCTGPPSIRAELTGINEVSLNWNTIGNNRSVTAFEQFNIYRKFNEDDLTLLAATSDTFYIDYLIQGGRYCYQVKAVFNDAGIICESNLSDSAYIISTFNVPENIDEEKISIFPNPAQDILYIKSDEIIQNVFLINTMGIGVLTVEQPGFNVDIDMKRIAKGIYLVRIETIDNIYHRKIIH